MPLTLDPSSRHEPLRQRLQKALSRFRFVTVVRSVSLIAAAVLALLASFAWLDWQFHLPALVRACELTLLSTLTIVLVLRFVLVPLRKEGTLLAMAYRVERQVPALNDSLVSALEFLESSGNPLLGSLELREEAISRAALDAEDLDFSEVITSRWLKRSVFLLLAVCAGAVVAVNNDPVSSATALTRLFVPFDANAWPAKTTIEILSPETIPHRMIRGNPFDLRVHLHGVIPTRLKLGLWPEGGAPTEQVYLISRSEHASSEAEFKVRIESNRVSRDFRFRIRANDADTDWQQVNVLSPPVLAPRDGRPSPQIHLTFPAYSELGAVDLPDGASVIESINGTRVQLKAAADRSIAHAGLKFTPDLPQLTIGAFLAPIGAVNAMPSASALISGREIWGETPVRLSSSGILLDVDFIPRITGPYVLRIEDASGLGSERIIDIRVRPDPVPKVELVKPAVEKKPLVLTTEGVFGLTAIATDLEFALRQVFLEYRTGNDLEYRRIEYFDSKNASVLISNLASLMHVPIALPVGKPRRLQSFTFDKSFAVRQFAHPDGSLLMEGDVLIVRIGANDFDDVYPHKPTGYSREIEIQIVSRRHLEAILQQVLSQMRNALLELEEQQRGAEAKVQLSRKELASKGRLDRESIERLLQAEQEQKLINTKIKAANDGLLSRALRMKQTIAQNKLGLSKTQERVEIVVAELTRLVAEELDVIEPSLSVARAEHDKGTSGRAQAALEDAARHQHEIQNTILSLVERLEPGSGTGEIQGELRSIIGELRKQMQTLEETKRSAPQNMTGSQRENLPQSVRDQLDREAVRQERLSERIRLTIEKLERLVEEKETAVNENLKQAQQKDAKARDLDDEARKAPKDDQRKQALAKQADKLRDEAQNHRESADALKEEINALREALKRDDTAQLSKQTAEAAVQIRANQLSDALRSQDSVTKNLESILEAMQAEPKTDLDDRLQRKRKLADARLEKLIGDQELLQKKVHESKKLTDPMQREQEFLNLSREQERLRKEALDLAETLSRAKAETVAREVRRSSRQMDDARQQLEEGEAPDVNQDLALQHLDEAQDQLANIRDRSEDQLLRERITRSADEIRAIRDRLLSAVNEEKRLHGKVVNEQGWKLVSAKETLPGLIDQQQSLSQEIRGIAEKRFSSTPVFDRMLRHAANAIDEAVKKLEARKEDVLDQLEGIASFNASEETRMHDAITHQVEIAVKRLNQLLDALNLKDDAMQAQVGNRKKGPMNSDMPNDSPGDVVPPVAQLKALRALQADVVERTTAFDKLHPDRSSLTPDETLELELLRRAQLEVAELVKELSSRQTTGDSP